MKQATPENSTAIVNALSGNSVNSLLEAEVRRKLASLGCAWTDKTLDHRVSITFCRAFDIRKIYPPH